ncbi:MAG: uroporphyrinogen-III C-methyltransferase [Alphaproteobacteria bacterium]|nr:uroporphyrinogen-III C-methyltransferase [Alphaproteobacteria bacterium]
MKSSIKNLYPDFLPGSVWLVGAGPGDPGLLTMLAWYALKEADVIIYDALVSTEILALIDSHKTIEFAGKRGGKPSIKQPDITLRLIELAKERKKVLRLKGGDPLIFGRGVEEALSLVAASIPFRFIPGISAGVGGLSYAGIPLTCRDTNSSIILITGHDLTGQIPQSIDWQLLGKTTSPLIFYMALKHLDIIINNLLNHGRNFNEPVAIVSCATLNNQLVFESTLGHMIQHISTETIDPPALFVVGDIVKLRAGLDWLGAQNGRKLISDPLNKQENTGHG